MSILTHLKDRISGKVPAGTRRSSEWPTLRKLFLKSHPACMVCQGTKKLEVHHVKPFHLHPELELEFSNLLTLCESGHGGMNCHLAVGHLGNFKLENTHVRDDSDFWRKRKAEVGEL